MEIRRSFKRLKTILGVNQAMPASGAAARKDRATLSTAEAGVRVEKVVAMQSAIAAKTYNVPASAVASKMVDAMLAGGE